MIPLLDTFGAEMGSMDVRGVVDVLVALSYASGSVEV